MELPVEWSWLIALGAASLAGLFYLRMNRQAEEERAAPDPGNAILEFGRAFPEEAIRAIHATEDGGAFFVRLHDERVGLMLSRGAHYACYRFEAGQIRLDHAPDAQTLAIIFTQFDKLNGLYHFSTSEAAGDVSLWLLGSFRT
ncbi:hypothetical protein BJF93_10410 [Xaviernesmea oryzae]|uniref:Uncharacterized protein n=1 Tax=Xaviernesmea oryzae TaxID=464029 RepID=A0A1Q9AX22_9HYPH|nr:hypothetical protein [Xaviernesmea oryzae]OLP59985.1 hypothetical protein BJF93_10410 [Xaviernesmea oryzae]SEK41667.1 hypothetical protein SAMN04487976_102130 [Xaviernesmea oryzae]